MGNLIFMSAFLLMLQAASPKASDVQALTKVLASAFVADQAVFMCTLEIKSFALQTAGPLGTSRDYLEHIKTEVLTDIPALEATQIVVGAADIARDAGRSQARTFSPNYPDIPAAGLRNWCQTKGIAIVRDFMTKHDKAHEKFLSEIADAKRPAM
jgi:hypothetical protein